MSATSINKPIGSGLADGPVGSQFKCSRYAMHPKQFTDPVSNSSPVPGQIIPIYPVKAIGCKLDIFINWDGISIPTASAQSGSQVLDPDNLEPASNGQGFYSYSNGQGFSVAGDMYDYPNTWIGGEDSSVPTLSTNWWAGGCTNGNPVLAGFAIGYYLKIGRYNWKIKTNGAENGFIFGKLGVSGWENGYTTFGGMAIPWLQQYRGLWNGPGMTPQYPQDGTHVRGLGQQLAYIPDSFIANNPHAEMGWDISAPIDASGVVVLDTWANSIDRVAIIPNPYIAPALVNVRDSWQVVFQVPGFGNIFQWNYPNFGAPPPPVGNNRALHVEFKIWSSDQPEPPFQSPL